MLRLINVEVAYNQVIFVLRGVSLEVGAGQLIAILGANGAGKTTTLKAISGLLRSEMGEVTDGSIEFEGQKIDKKRPEDIAKMGIIQVMEGRQLFRHMTVEENLMIGAHLRSNPASVKRDLDLLHNYFPRLKELQHRVSGYLSGGEQQMLVIGRAYIARPRLMLLDEPSLGLAPMLVDEIYEIIRRMNSEEKTSIFLVEQNAMVALAVAHYGYVLENGRVVLEGAAEKLIRNPDIREFYLGLSAIGEKRSYREVKHYKRRKRWL